MDYGDFCRQFHIAKLNPQQEAAVKQVDGPILLLATPGSGKTTVLVARTGYMIHCAGIPGQRILALTYTKAAAAEMKERFVAKFATAPDNTPRFSTINSFCVSVMRTCEREKGCSFPALLANNEPVVRRAAWECMNEYPNDQVVRTLTQKVGKIKNEMLNDLQITNLATDDINIDMFLFYRRYQEMLREQNQMDFDDQLIFAYQLLQDYPDILARVRRQYQYVSLDEAQDTSLIQHRIVQLMVGRKGNIFMVGDEDQSIYGFRGAYPAALLSFGSDYDNAKLLYMETNYRSDTSIVNAANQFIKRNELRNDKNMKAASQEKGKIVITRVHRMKDLYEALMDRVSDMLNRPDHTLAILAKNNEALLPLMDRIEMLGLPIVCRDAGVSFFSHYLVLDLLSIIQFAQDPSNTDLLRALYYKLDLYITKDTVERAIQDQEPGQNLLELLSDYCDEKRAKKLSYLNLVFHGITTAPPFRALTMAMEDTGYQDGWVEKKIAEGASEQSLMMKYNILKLLAARHDTVEAFLKAIQTLRTPTSTKGANITLSTIHSSKGLEFDHVIMIDILAGILPSGQRDLTQNEREEEARMFYVGATRAKHTLEIMLPDSVNDVPLSPSEFAVAYSRLDENGMPKPEPTPEPPKAPSKGVKMGYTADRQGPKIDLSTLKRGDHIKHISFGPGVVKDLLPGDIFLVDFVEVGEKKLLRSSCEKLAAIQRLP